MTEITETIKDNNNEPILEAETGLEYNENQSINIYPDVNIKISRDQYSIFETREMVKIGDIDIDPDFQRHFVWKKIQKNELIESVLMGVPLPTFYIFEQKDGKKQVIDGRQRLTTLHDFLDNKFCLKDLKILKDFNNKRFEDFEERYKSKFKRFQLSMVIIEPPTPSQVKYDIFNRVNKGGTILNNQEMRNALFHGKSTDLLLELTQSDFFKKAISNGVSSKRMKDQYIVLRFIAFYLLYTHKFQYDYTGDINFYLDEVMEFLNKKADIELINHIKNVFYFVMKNACLFPNKDCFRYKSNNFRPRPINMILFETISYIFATKYNNNFKEENLINKINELKEKLDTDTKLKNNLDSSSITDYRFITIVNDFWRNFEC